MNAYKKLCQELEMLEKEIERTEKRKEETKARVSSGEKTINRLADSLKEPLLSGDEKAVHQIEKDAQKTRVDLDRDRVLLDGLKNQLQVMKDRLGNLTDKKKSLFAEMAREWIEKEIQEHDRLAEELRNRVRRLLGCHRILREMGHQDIYREALGEAFEYVPGERLIIIREFQPALFRNYKANTVTGEDLKTVEIEIIGK